MAHAFEMAHGLDCLRCYFSDQMDGYLTTLSEDVGAEKAHALALDAEAMLIATGDRVMDYSPGGHGPRDYVAGPFVSCNKGVGAAIEACRAALMLEPATRVEPEPPESWTTASVTSASSASVASAAATDTPSKAPDVAASAVSTLKHSLLGMFGWSAGGDQVSALQIDREQAKLVEAAQVKARHSKLIRDCWQHAVKANEESMGSSAHMVKMKAMLTELARMDKDHPELRAPFVSEGPLVQAVSDELARRGSEDVSDVSNVQSFDGLKVRVIGKGERPFRGIEVDEVLKLHKGESYDKLWIQEHPYSGSLGFVGWDQSFSPIVKVEAAT